MRKTTKVSFTMTENEFNNHRAAYNGLCLACGEVHYGDVEPDARRYECENCGVKRVYGIEELLLMGLITISEND